MNLRPHIESRAKVVRAALVWLCICVVVFAVSWQTLLVAPGVYPDEVQILDFGRGFIDGPTEHSVAWNVLTGKPTATPEFIGVCIPEIAFRVFDLSPYAPRAICVLGGLFSATAFLLWTVSRGVRISLALAGAVAFLLDPLSVASARCGRVDMWAVGFALIACWLIALAAASLGGRRSAASCAALALAGIFSALTPFIWTSSIFLGPLVLSQLGLLIPWNQLGTVAAWRKPLAGLACFGVGGLSTFCVLLIPVLPTLTEVVADFAGHVSVLKGKGVLNDLTAFLLSFRVTPVAFAAAILGLIVGWKRSPLLVLAAIATTAMALPTEVYHFRSVYLLPSYYALFMVGCFAGVEHMQRAFSFRIALIALSALVLWNVAISLGLRTWLGHHRAAANDPAQVLRVAADAIGPGPLKVYDARMTFYHSGRKLGWKMYRPLLARAFGDWTDDDFAKFLEIIDVAIIPEDQQRGGSVERFSTDEEAVLRRCGFAFDGTYAIAATEATQKSGSQWWNRVLLGGGPNYGSYKVYVKATPAL